MVKILVCGGLGNQLWQYAAAYALAQRLGTNLLVQPSPPTLNRKFLLDYFSFDFKLCSQWLSNIPGLYRRFDKLFFHDYQNKNEFHYDEGFFKLPNQTKITASYFQNYRYFMPVLDQLRRQLDVRHTTDELKMQLNIIRQQNAVAVHVRRGDYLTAESKGKPFRICSLKYYQEAILLMRQKLLKPKFFIFW